MPNKSKSKKEKTNEINAKETFNELIEYAITADSKTKFKIFSAIFVAIIPVGVWLLRSIGFSYQAGVFSVYNISNSYIQIGDNFFNQLIQDIGILIVLFLSNLIFILVLIRVQGTFKKALYVLFLCILEMIFWFSYVMIGANLNFYLLIEGFSFQLLKQMVCEVMPMLIAMVIITNIFVIPIYLLKIRRTRNTKTLHIENITQEDIIAALITAVIVCALLLPLSYFRGIINENSRSNYKVLVEKMSSENDQLSGDNPYTFIGSNEIFENNNIGYLINDNTSYNLYAIIFENEENYIISALSHKEDNKVFLNKTYQKVISKQDITTYLFKDISK